MHSKQPQRDIDDTFNTCKVFYDLISNSGKCKSSSRIPATITQQLCRANRTRVARKSKSAIHFSTSKPLQHVNRSLYQYNNTINTSCLYLAFSSSTLSPKATKTRKHNKIATNFRKNSKSVRNRNHLEIEVN